MDYENYKKSNPNDASKSRWWIDRKYKEMIERDTKLLEVLKKEEESDN
jgi:hypothetical protein